MAIARFTPHLYRYFPSLPAAGAVVTGSTVGEVLSGLDRMYPGLRGYIVDDAGAVRKHVNIFVDGRWIADRRTLGDAVSPGGEVYFFQALSGG